MLTALRALAAAVLVAVALGASGCGTETVDPATIADAAEATERAGGAKLSIEGEGSARGQTVDISGTGEMDEQGRSEMVMEVPGRGSMRQVFADYVVYQSMPGVEEQFGEEWMKMDLRRAYEQIGIDIDLLAGPGGNDPRQMLAQMKNAAGEIEKVGTEDVRGVETTHYKGDVDLRKSIERLPADKRAAAERSVEKIIEISGTEGYPMEAWIDEKNLVRRLRMELSMNNPALGGKLDMEFTMDLFDYGKPVTIELPDDEDSVDLTDQVAAQLE